MNYFRCGGGRSTHTATKIDVAKTPLASFESNVSGLYIPEILAYIQATQAGTGDPSPSNPRPISGVSSVDTTRTGVNLWSYGNVSGTRYAYIAVNISAGTYNISAVVTSSDTDASNNIVGFRYADGTYIYAKIGRNTRDNTSVILAQDVNQIRFYASDSYDHSVDDTFTFADIQLQTGETATAYQPYTGQTATTTLGGTYYGGYLNVTTGLLTVTYGIVDLGSLSWTYRSGNKLFTAFKSGIKQSSDAKGTHCLCDIYKETYGGSWSGWANFPNEHISSGNNYSSGDANIAVKDLSYTDKDTFKTAMNGVKLVYELATPQTVQLTPAQIEQLLGQNNVFCSSGDVAVKYWKID